MSNASGVLPATWERDCKVLAALALIALAAPWFVAMLLPAWEQPQAYHAFADRRAWGSLPNAANVLSNLVFLLIGAAGLSFTIRWTRVRPQAFASAAAAWPYRLLFAATALTAFGSASYHLGPNDATLLWDRLPIALAFSGLVGGVFADRVPKWSLALTAALAITGCGTVVYWTASGNLLPYLAMQAAFVGVALAATAMIRSHYSHARWIYAAVVVYALALAAERYDHSVYQALGDLLSGHTLKHLLAAAAIAIILAMLRRRSRA